MSRSPSRVLTFALGLTALVLVFTPPARGTDPAPAGGKPPAAPVGEFVKCHVHPTSKDVPEFDGTLKLDVIEVRTETDTRYIKMIHVKRITFAGTTDEKAQDTIELDSHDIVRGKVLTAEFPFEIGPDKIRTEKKADLREIRTEKEESLSLMAILIGLLTLTAMEIVLGIDNIIFLAIVTSKLPPEQQPKARQIGLAAALGTRLLLLLSLSFLLELTAPLFTLPDLPLISDTEAREVSWRDLILLLGGMFLIGKSTLEMHEKIEHAKAAGQAHADESKPGGKVTTFARAIVTIAIIDIVFSLDSVITAVGMVKQVWVMMIAMVIAMGVMLAFSGPISRFVDKNPTIKVLALAFLILIGVMLVAEGLGQHMNKGYIYFAMGFAISIEMINMQLRRAHGKPTETPPASEPGPSPPEPPPASPEPATGSPQ